MRWVNATAVAALPLVNEGLREVIAMAMEMVAHCGA